MLYKPNTTINGYPCHVSVWGAVTDKHYNVFFDRTLVSLDQVEAIDWDNITVGDYCPFEKGYGFVVDRIDYHHTDKSIEVCLKLGDQYLGDVSRYKTELQTKDATIQEKNQAISTLKKDNAAALAEKDNVISEKESAISELNSQLTQKDNVISANESTISELNGQLAQADETIIEMETQLAEADEAMMAMYEEMAAANPAALSE